MRIQKLTITHKELIHAVETYLVSQGVSAPVEDISRTYSYGSTWEVQIKEPESPAAPPEIPEPVTTAEKEVA